MDPQKLIATGLTAIQASAYSYLIELGEVKPPALAAKLKTTRTNAYKVLDRLVELGLAQKTEEGKKLTYKTANPIALAHLTASYRAEVTAREEAANSIMRELLHKYQTYADKPGIDTFTGQQAVAEAYRRQINLSEDIYFIHTHADIPAMGFDTMHTLRVAPGSRGNKRHAIMRPSQDASVINHAAHERGNLAVTWAGQGDYDAPVEWSVTESSLLIVSYAAEPQAVLIVDAVIAGAFLQLWRLLSSLLEKQPVHQKLKPKS